MAFDEIRKNTPCKFKDGLSEEEFDQLGTNLANKIKRITNIWFERAIIHCTVESQHHISEWSFSVDFNNWGHITGTFWTETENLDSSIPKNFGMTISGWIHEILDARDVHIRDLSDDVDNHENLDTLIASGISGSRSFFKYLSDEVFKYKNQVSINHSSWDLYGENLFPVFAQLINSFPMCETIPRPIFQG